jgi:hypothetical protein
MSGRKIVSSILISLGVLLVIYITVHRLQSVQVLDKRFELLQTSWSEDVRKLRASGGFPPQIDDISAVKVEATDGPLKFFAGKAAPGFPTKSDGKYELHVLMDEMPTERGVIIRYDLVEKSQGNTVWEVSRSLPVKISP